MSVYGLQWLKWTKLGRAKLFRGFEEPGKAKRQQERYKKQFQKLQNTIQGKTDVFRRKIQRS